MALIDPPAFLGLSGNQYPAARMRRVHQLMLGGREGCLAAGDMIVTQTGTPSLSVQVSAGSAVVNGDDAVRQGAYVVDNDAAVTVGPVSTPHASLARIDRLVLEVLDQEGTVSGGGGRASDLPRYRIVAGTPSASPSAPVEPPTAITLALIAVSAGASAITNAAITDWRPAINPRAGDVGEMSFVYASSAPWGALIANGGPIDSARYPALHARIGANLPDVLGRTLIGAGAGSGLTNRNLGDKPGGEGLPSHSHSAGSLVALPDGSHTHGGSTLGISAAADHQHGPGNLRTANSGHHNHGYWRAGVGAEYRVSTREWDVTIPPQGEQLVATEPGGDHNHVLQSGATDPAGSHGHSVSGNVTSDGQHGHTVSGVTANAGAGSHGVIQPSLAALPIIWT